MVLKMTFCDFPLTLAAGDTLPSLTAAPYVPSQATGNKGAKQEQSVQRQMRHV